MPMSPALGRPETRVPSLPCQVRPVLNDRGAVRAGVIPVCSSLQPARLGTPASCHQSKV
jgi:hypothetical protein